MDEAYKYLDNLLKDKDIVVAGISVIKNKKDFSPFFSAILIIIC